MVDGKGVGVSGRIHIREFYITAGQNDSCQSQCKSGSVGIKLNRFRVIGQGNHNLIQRARAPVNRGVDPITGLPSYFIISGRTVDLIQVPAPDEDVVAPTAIQLIVAGPAA